MNKLKDFKTMLIRRVLKLSRTERRINADVLRTMNKDRELIATDRRTEHLCIFMRNKKYKILLFLINYKIGGKRGISCNIRQRTRLNTTERLIYTKRKRNVISKLKYGRNHRLSDKHGNKKTLK